MILALVPRRIHRHWELRDVAIFESADFADALFVNFIDTNDGMHRQVGSLHILEFGFDFFFGRIDDNRCPFAENQFLDFDKAEQLAMANTPSVDLIDLPLAHEDDFEESFLTHFCWLLLEGA